MQDFEIFQSLLILQSRSSIATKHRMQEQNILIGFCQRHNVDYKLLRTAVLSLVSKRIRSLYVVYTDHSKSPYSRYVPPSLSSICLKEASGRAIDQDINILHSVVWLCLAKVVIESNKQF